MRGGLNHHEYCREHARMVARYYWKDQVENVIWNLATLSMKLPNTAMCFHLLY